MCPYESYEGHLKFVLDGNHKTIGIPFDIEYEPAMTENIGCPVFRFNVLRTLPLSLLASAYHALKGFSASGCRCQKSFRVFTEMTLTTQFTPFPIWEQVSILVLT